MGPRTQRPAVPQAQSLQPFPHATSRSLQDHPRETEPSGDKNRPLDHLTEKSEAEPHVLGCFRRVSWWRVRSLVALRVVSSGPVSWEGLLCSKWVVLAPPPLKAVGFWQSTRCCLWAAGFTGPTEGPLGTGGSPEDLGHLDARQPARPCVRV